MVRECYALFWPTRPQDPIVLVLSPLSRTVLVLVIDRFDGIASLRSSTRTTKFIGSSRRP